MTALGLLILVGSQTSHKVGARPNPVFIAVWLIVTGLVVVLLVLAALDWQATRRYARRHRSAIVREGMELLKEEMRRRSAPPPDGNGRARGGQDA
jgi:O-antigen/teichoic acid export membrane protein